MCVSVPSSEQAIEELSKRAFDLAIIDMKLSGYDSHYFRGLDVLGWADRNNVSIMIIISTGYGTADLVERAYMSGRVVGLFDKSNTDIATLVKTVKEALNN